MCDERTNKEQQAYLSGQKGLTRRAFGKLGAGIALATMMPPIANAQNVIEQDVKIKMAEGTADGYFVHPASGQHAAVIVWPDIMGTRPAFRAMGKRLAQSGYAVLVVNPYYRTVTGQVTPDGKSFGDPETRAMLMPHARSLSPATAVSDGKDYVSWLDSQDSVDTNRMIGTTGYCMTGSYVMRLAAAIPTRIGAGGSFHGGGLVSDADDSPHLLAPDIKAGLLIAIAENDDAKEPDTKHVLRASLGTAKVDAEIEVYEGTLHGWCPPDSRVYNEAMAEKAWSNLLALFEKELA